MLSCCTNYANSSSPARLRFSNCSLARSRVQQTKSVQPMQQESPLKDEGWLSREESLPKDEGWRLPLVDQEEEPSVYKGHTEFGTPAEEGVEEEPIVAVVDDEDLANVNEQFLDHDLASVSEHLYTEVEESEEEVLSALEQESGDEYHTQDDQEQGEFFTVAGLDSADDFGSVCDSDSQHEPVFGASMSLNAHEVVSPNLPEAGQIPTNRRFSLRGVRSSTTKKKRRMSRSRRASLPALQMKSGSVGDGAPSKKPGHTMKKKRRWSRRASLPALQMFGSAPGGGIVGGAASKKPEHKQRVFRRYRTWSTGALKLAGQNLAPRTPRPLSDRAKEGLLQLEKDVKWFGADAAFSMPPLGLC